MKNEILRIEDYEGEGYQPLVDFGGWRVAYLRFIDELIPNKITQLERHLETDEVFVLLEGEAVLFLGQGNDQIVDISCHQMKSGKLYIVRKNGWHSCVLSRDAKILLVENQDTCSENTDYIKLGEKEKKFIVDKTKDFIRDWY